MSQTPLLNLEQIKEIIPHRDPFLLIDEVLEMKVGEYVIAQKHLKEDEYWFKGHFPGEPVQPGVLMLEMLAQAGAVCILSKPENKGKLAFFAGLDKVRFKGIVKPGDTLRLEVKVIKEKLGIAVSQADAYVDGKKVVTAQITSALSK